MKKNNTYLPKVGFYFNTLPNNKEWFNIRETALFCGLSPQTIRNAINEGKIYAHKYLFRKKNRMAMPRKVYRVSRQSILLCLLKSANYTSSDVLKSLNEVIKYLNNNDLEYLYYSVKELLASKSQN